MINKINIDELELTGCLYDEMKHIRFINANSIFQIDAEHQFKNSIEDILYKKYDYHN